MNAFFKLSDVLDDAATGGERALTDAIKREPWTIPAERVTATWEPEAGCPTELLPVAAFNFGVNLYEPVWSVETKREWIGKQWEFQAIRGTVAGVRRALGINGFDLQEYLKPRQGFYASPDLTQAERDAWVFLMPELRITFKKHVGHDNGQWFADDGFAGDAFAGLDDGEALYGNEAFIRQRGEVRPVRNISLTTAVERRTGREVQRYSTIGRSTCGWHAGDFADGFFFVNAEEEPAQIYTLIADVAYEHVRSRLDLTTLIPSLDPIDARYEIESDRGWWGYQTFAGICAADVDFAGDDDAFSLLARRIFLLDPTVQVPRTLGLSFANYDRVGIPLRTAEMLVDLNTKAWSADAFVDDVEASGVYALPENRSHQERAIRAIEAARGHLDRVLVRFDHVRPLNVSDTILEGTRLGAWVRNSL